MLEAILEWIEDHEVLTVIISAVIGTFLALAAKDALHAVLQLAKDLL